MPIAANQVDTPTNFTLCTSHYLNVVCVRVVNRDPRLICIHMSLKDQGGMIQSPLRALRTPRCISDDLQILALVQPICACS